MVKLHTKWLNLDEAFAELEAELTQVTRGLTVEVWDRILRTTPQYYGGLVASWTYSLNQPVFLDRSNLVPNMAPEGSHIDEYPIRKKGDIIPIGIANQMNKGNDNPFKLGDTVYYSNGADHGDGAYAQLIEDASVPLRSVNQPGRMAQRAFDYASARYGGSVKKARAPQLAAMKIGG